jgi:hypothetical protein
MCLKLLSHATQFNPGQSDELEFLLDVRIFEKIVPLLIQPIVVSSAVLPVGYIADNSFS